MITNRDAEHAVLTACVLSPLARTEAKRRITGKDFDDPLHETVWNAICTLERHGKDVDWITLSHVLANQPRALELIPGLVTNASLPEHVVDYADIVADRAMLRRLDTEAQWALGQIRRPDVTGRGLATKIANRFAAVRDGGLSTEEITALTLEELVGLPEEPYDWIIPDLLERSDRLVLTGEEGLGKSHLLRQVAVFAAAGLDPFRETRVAPCKVVVVDCENTQRQVKRAIEPLYRYAQRTGLDPGGRVTIECTGRLDVTADRDLARIHHLLDATLPDIVVIGPMYRLIPRAVTNDDDAAPLLTALDSIRDRGIALLIEAHAGHGLGKHGVRDLRPRGSSALLGWPEFGYGMRSRDDGSCDLVPWRGDRVSRSWPETLRKASSDRWLEVESIYTGARQ